MRVGRSGPVLRRATGRRTAGPVGRTAPPSGRALRVGPAGRPGAGWHGRPGPREAGAGAVGGEAAKSTKSKYRAAVLICYFL